MTYYRRVSLLTAFHKVLEKAMHSRFSRLLHTDNIMVTEQCGFMRGISTESPAFRLPGSVLNLLTKKKVGGIFCDLAETFDCLNHEMF